VRDQLKMNLPKLPPADFALIHLGTNDQSSRDYRNDVLAPLQDIVKMLRKRNPNVTVLVGHLNFNGGAALKIRPIVEEIRALSDENSRVATVHHYRGWNERPDHPETDTFDWAHPNLQGQRKMAESWFQAMKPTLTSH
jgi:lysophospholipase L1-like esterase